MNKVKNMMAQLKCTNFCLIILLLIFSNELDAQATNKDSVNCAKLKKQMIFLTDDSIHVKLSYIGYPCGECIPQYKVDSVLFSSGSKTGYYYNKEIDVVYLNKDLQHQLDNFKCSWSCYVFYLNGKFKRNLLGMLRLEVIGGKIEIKKSCRHCN